MLYSESYFSSRLTQQMRVFNGFGLYAQGVTSKNPEEILRADLKVFADITKLISGENIDGIVSSLGNLINKDWSKLSGAKIYTVVNNQNLAARTKLALLEHLKSCEARRKLANGIKDGIDVRSFTSAKGEHLSIASISLPGLKTDLNSDVCRVANDGSPLIAIVCSGYAGGPGSLERSSLSGRFAANYYAERLVEGAKTIMNKVHSDDEKMRDRLVRFFTGENDNLDLECGTFLQRLFADSYEISSPSYQLLNFVDLKTVFFRHKYGASINYGELNSDDFNVGFKPIDEQVGYLNGFVPEDYLINDDEEGCLQLNEEKIAPELNQYFLGLSRTKDIAEIMEIFMTGPLDTSSEFVTRYQSDRLIQALKEELKDITNCFQQELETMSADSHEDFDALASVAMAFDLGTHYALINIGNSHAFVVSDSPQTIEMSSDWRHALGAEVPLGVIHHGDKFEQVKYSPGHRIVKKSDCDGIVLGSRGALDKFFVRVPAGGESQNSQMDDQEIYYELDAHNLKEGVFDLANGDPQELLIGLLNERTVPGKPSADETLIVAMHD